MIRHLTYRISELWSSGDLCADLLELSGDAETTVPLCGILQEQPRQQRGFAGEFMPHSHCSGCYITTRHFIWSYSSLLQSQDLLHHIMACLIESTLYIYVRTICLQMVIDHNRRSTWPRTLKELWDASHGGSWSEMLKQKGWEPTINTPAHLSQHWNWILEIQ
jgi:hypothetical protein